jgi:Leucine-rich repeat (LRR) protein
MKNRTLIILLLFCGCRNFSNKEIFKNSITFKEDLVIKSNDSLILQSSRKRNQFTDYSDSTENLCKLVGDTLKLYLSTGQFEGAYFLNLLVINDTFNASFELFDNYSKYVYSPSAISISLNKRKFKVDDYIVAEINYNAIGKLQNFKESPNDTVCFKGKIRLKVRDSNFTFKDFYIENQRNEFYAMLKQRPDTIKKLNLYGCAFTDLPKELPLFTNLEELDLSGNDMSKSNFSILRNLKALKTLDLTECNLSDIPSAIFSLPRIETLNIWNNKICTIPDGLYNLVSLKHLTLGNNCVSFLSPKISNLINLESFESSSSRIKVYPKEMAKLKKITEIYPNDTMEFIPKDLIKYAWGCDTILNK